MKLSAKTRYGLKVMCYLAKEEGKGPISLSTIAQEIEASDKYTEQILLELRKANLVQATRGANGGYLEEDSKDITVGAIVRTLEDDLLIVNCVSDNNTCPNKASCQTHVVWENLYNEMNKLLDSMSLQSIIRK